MVALYPGLFTPEFVTRSIVTLGSPGETDLLFCYFLLGEYSYLG